MPQTTQQPMIADRQLEELGGCGFALAMQMLGRREDASDAVQDALHQLIRKWQLYDAERGELRAWFLKIVRNRCIDVLRQRARRRTESAELAEQCAAGGPSPASCAQTHETLERLQGVLMSMPQEQREMILLRDFHQLSYAEVARVLSIPKGTVMSRLHRARTALRERMENAS